MKKAQILGAGAKNSCQVRIIIELRGKSNKICVKIKKIRALGQIESGRREAGVLNFFYKNLGGTVDILCSLGSNHVSYHGIQ